MKNKKKQTGQACACPLARACAASLPRFSLECAEKYELLVCGCRKIELYSPEETVICTQGGKVRVAGAKLTIALMGEGKIMLSGVISAIEFK